MHVTKTFLLGPVFDCESQLEASLSKQKVIVFGNFHFGDLISFASFFVSGDEDDKSITLLKPFTFWGISLEHVDFHH